MSECDLPRVVWLSHDGCYRIVGGWDEEEHAPYFVVERQVGYDALGQRHWECASTEPLDYRGALPAKYAGELALALVTVPA